MNDYETSYVSNKISWTAELKHPIIKNSKKI